MTKKMAALVGGLAAVLVLGIGLAFATARMGGDRMHEDRMHEARMHDGSSMMAGPMGGHGMGGTPMGSDHMMQGWQGSGSTPAPIAGARELAVTAENVAFTPSTLTVGAGEAANIAFHNADGVVHDFTIPSLGLHVAAQPGATVTFGLQIPSTGSYEYLCSVPGHAAAGMRGTITVTG